MDKILVVLTYFLAIVTVLPLWRHDAWWVRGLDFPRFQFMLAALFMFVAEAIVLDFSRFDSWLMLGIALGSFCFHCGWILPYTRLFPVEVKTAKHREPENLIRILTANVLMPNRNADGLLHLVKKHQPDVLVALETNLWWEEQLRVLENEYRYTIKCPLENKYGMHVYSRLQLEDAAIQYLVEPDVPSMHALVVLRSSKKVRVHFLHPAPPSPTENLASSERDAELLVVAKSVSDELSPIIVTGDLNDVAWSSTTRLFRKISGLLDPRIGRGMFNTFHADILIARWPLDHLFHSEHFTLAHIERLPYFGSDHFPMLVELEYDETHGADQQGLLAEQEDHEWAERKMDEHEVEESDVHEPGKRKF
ncbi:endonuclease/exonuclease/phosphatase family protein [Pontibacter sp. KCTC 32443]|uniref:endonuclease/exonuclease/phosphatase family protein n=1 Tax=Pontibacter TaxID=323449 RepID=UPI00164E8334|nr:MULTISPECIES: endonuclease/exonuclease/phosphatase family protein [Pontibacter]MBC5773699.1 endonuclease/exonuclease/phosphatase family protein [Pontibacter sp. KCTC 32443]